MTIEMAGLLQENVNHGQEELSSDDDMDQEEEEVWEEEEEDSGDEMETMENDVDSGSSSPGKGEPSTWIRDQFREYVADAKTNFKPFTKEEEKTLRLLKLLKDKNAPMNAYESIMLWHLHETKALSEHQTLQDS
jgi:cobalamin biosynthesis protein CobT